AFLADALVDEGVAAGRLRMRGARAQPEQAEGQEEEDVARRSDHRVSLEAPGHPRADREAPQWGCRPGAVTTRAAPESTETGRRQLPGVRGPAPHFQPST